MSVTPPPGSAATPGNQDPSMEDILASIRRILDEQQPPARPDMADEASAQRPADDVLILDRSMIVPEGATQPREAPSSSPTSASSAASAVPEATATTAVEELPHQVAAERTLQVHAGGPTIEDIVRVEMRPLLKMWLDANLPDLVERLVRAEIERLVRRTVP